MCLVLEIREVLREKHELTVIAAVFKRSSRIAED